MLKFKHVHNFFTKPIWYIGMYFFILSPGRVIEIDKVLNHLFSYFTIVLWYLITDNMRIPYKEKNYVWHLNISKNPVLYTLVRTKRGWGVKPKMLLNMIPLKVYYGVILVVVGLVCFSLSRVTSHEFCQWKWSCITWGYRFVYTFLSFC